MKAKAAILFEQGAPFVIDTIDVDDPKDDEVLVKIAGTGVCGTDANFRGPSTLTYPTVLGHEGAGTIVKIGKNVTNCKIGDNVIMANAFCGTCDNCLSGNSHICTTLSVNPYGRMQDNTYRAHYNGQDCSTMFSQGTFREYVVANKNCLTIIPEDIPVESAGPIGCGIKTGSGAVFYTLKPEVNSTIVIFGTGTVGLSAVMSAKIAQCKNIICLDIVDSRLELAKELGATHIINTRNQDAVKAVLEIAPKGVDSIIDTAGNNALLEKSIDMIKPGGTVVICSMYKDPSVKLLTVQTIGKGIIFKIHKDTGGPTPALFRNIFDFHARGMFPYEKLITYYEFEEIEKAFEDFHSGKVIKPILKF